MSARADVPDADQLRAVVLESHNMERARWQAPPLRWSNMLAAGAQAHAEELARAGTLYHGRIAGPKPRGENLWIGTHGAYGYDQMVDAFLRERRHYVARAFPQTSATGRWSDTGHYSQIIWRTTTQVGCGIAVGENFDVLVCRYDPAGNIVGLRADEDEQVAQDTRAARGVRLASLGD